MSVLLWLKCQSVLHGNLHYDEKKKWQAHKTLSWFTNTKVYPLLLHLLVIVEKRETAYKKWVDHFNLTKRNKMLWGERKRADTDFDIIFLVFCCCPCMWLFADYVFTALCLGSSWSFPLICPVSTSFNCFSVLVASSQSELITDLLLIHFFFNSDVPNYITQSLGSSINKAKICSDSD